MEVKKLLSAVLCTAYVAALAVVPVHADGTENSVIANVDFENYNVTATDIDLENKDNNVHPNPANDNLGYVGNVDYKQDNPESVFVLKEKSSDNKFLRVYNKKNFSSNCYSDGTYDTQIVKDVALDGTNSLSVEYKARVMEGEKATVFPNSGYTYMHAFRMNTSAGVDWGIRMLGNEAPKLTVTDADDNTVAVLSSGEWTKIKAIYKPVDGKYNVEYYADDELKYTRTTNKESISNIWLIQVNTTDNSETGVWFDIDDIKIEYNPKTQFNCVSTDLTSTTDIRTSIGRIKLNFTEAVDADTVSGITMTDSKGNTPADFAVTADGNTAVLTFGELKEEMQYKITVPDTVLSASGSVAASAEFRFTTATNTLARVDFENYTDALNTEIKFDDTDVHPNAAADKLGYVGNVDYTPDNPESVFVLKEKSSDNKFLRVYNKKNFSSNCYSDGTYDTQVVKDVNLDGTNSLAVEYKIKAMDGMDSGAFANSIMHTLDFKATSGSVWGARMTGQSGSNLTVTDADDNIIAALSSDEWTKIKAIYKPADGKYNVEYYANGKLKYTRTTDKTGITNVGIVYVNTTGGNGVWFDIDDIRVKYNPGDDFEYISNDMSTLSNVSTSIGSITLTFSDDVDAGTVSNITLTDSFGAPVPNVNITASGKNVTLTFDMLSEGTEYKVTIPDTVLSVKGMDAIESYFTFTTASSVVADVDFESYTNALNTEIKFDSTDVHPDYAADNLGYIGSITHDKTNPESVFVLKDKDSGNKFLRVYNKKNFSSNCYSDGTYDAEVRAAVRLDGTNSLAAELKIRAMTGNYDNVQMHNFTFYGSAGMTHGIMTRDTGLTVVDSDPVQSIGGLSSSEWTTLQAIYTPVNGKYRVDYYADGVLKGTRTTDAVDINEVRIALVYVAGDKEAWYDIDDIKVKYLQSPYVTGTNLENNVMPITQPTMTVYFSTDMNSDTINDENVVVKCGDEIVDTTVMYYPDGNRCVIGFKDYLTPDSEYTVKFNNVTSALGIELAASFTFRSGSAGLTYVSSKLSETKGGEVISTIPSSGNVYAEAVVNNGTGTDGSAIVILAAYDSDGRLINIASSTQAVASGKRETVYGNISGIAGAAEVRMYLWNNFETMNPILTTPTILK